MPLAGAAARRGRRGRRTGAMIRIANDRIFDLFALAEREAWPTPNDLPDRYVGLARKIGTRYNVRIPPELREQYCRGCSSYWVEGRSVRTRLRSGHRVRTCLVCGRVRRVPWGDRPAPREGSALPTRPDPAQLSAVAPVDLSEEHDDLEMDEDEP